MFAVLEGGRQGTWFRVRHCTDKDRAGVGTCPRSALSSAGDPRLCRWKKGRGRPRMMGSGRVAF
eukprot:scaffold69145_cov53-Phaeocystis_antarctica.AAC.6